MTCLWNNEEAKQEKFSMAIFTSISTHVDLSLLLKYLDEDNYPQLISYIAFMKKHGKFAKMRDQIELGTAHVHKTNKYELKYELENVE